MKRRWTKNLKRNARLDSMERQLKRKELKCILMLIWIILIGSVFNMNASTFNVDGDVVIIHTDKPKSSTTTSNSKPRHAPMHRKTKMVRLEFLQDMNDVIILLKESGQITETYNIGKILSGNEIPISISANSGESCIEIYSEGVKHQNIFENKKYNTCCFLNEQHILEECLLANVEKPIEAIHKITAI